MAERRDTSNDVCMGAKELKDWMIKHRVPTEELADILGLTNQAVLYWISGQRKIPEPIGRLLNYFDLKPERMREF